MSHIQKFIRFKFFYYFFIIMNLHFLWHFPAYFLDFSPATHVFPDKYVP